ncbi:MAG: precorrin-2 C(20)-methyltransferase [Desulfuromonas sp.]|nr:MAG: precorrin-2 C(20)-methyltransferase [Desulfuromonas sp.]
MDGTRAGSLVAVGVGPGDPELLTLKAVKALQGADVILAPKASREGGSVAAGIVAPHLDPERQELREQLYPMRKDPAELEQFWRDAAQEVAELLAGGRRVAFVTLGDPYLYSTFLYLRRFLLEQMPKARVEVISGLSSIQAAAAAADLPLALADERVAILPATFEDGRLRQTLEQFDTVVLMKVARVFGRVKELLRELDLLQSAVYVRQVGLPQEAIWHNLDAVDEDDLHYLSLIIVKK